MIDSLFNSDIEKNSKFDENFVGNILKQDEWLFLVSQFKSYLTNSNQNYSELFIPKKIQIVKISIEIILIQKF